MELRVRVKIKGTAFERLQIWGNAKEMAQIDEQTVGGM
jgi:hypothetical protein